MSCQLEVRAVLNVRHHRPDDGHTAFLRGSLQPQPACDTAANLSHFTVNDGGRSQRAPSSACCSWSLLAPLATSCFRPLSSCAHALSHDELHRRIAGSVADYGHSAALTSPSGRFSLRFIRSSAHLVLLDQTGQRCQAEKRQRHAQRLAEPAIRSGGNANPCGSSQRHGLHGNHAPGFAPFGIAHGFFKLKLQQHDHALSVPSGCTQT